MSDNNFPCRARHVVSLIAPLPRSFAGYIKARRPKLSDSCHNIAPLCRLSGSIWSLPSALRLIACVAKILTQILTGTRLNTTYELVHLR
jgi:hypothetical protein